MHLLSSAKAKPMPKWKGPAEIRNKKVKLHCVLGQPTKTDSINVVNVKRYNPTAEAWGWGIYTPALPHKGFFYIGFGKQVNKIKTAVPYKLQPIRLSVSMIDLLFISPNVFGSGLNSRESAQTCGA